MNFSHLKLNIFLFSLLVYILTSSLQAETLPHIDDFEIQVDNIKLTNFASRWETKSVILWLKLLETSFIEKTTKKKPILLIDDLLSELDNNNKKILIDKIKYYQTFITSIEFKNKDKNIIKL